MLALKVPPTAQADAMADLRAKAEPPRKPAAVQSAENHLRVRRKARAEAQQAHTAACQMPENAPGKSQAMADAAKVLGEADAAVGAARRDVDAAREKWKPAYRAAVDAPCAQAEAIITEALAAVEAAAAVLDDIHSQAARNGGMPTPRAPKAARHILDAVKGIRRALATF